MSIIGKYWAVLLVMGIVAVFLLVMNILLFRSLIFKKKK